MSKEDGREFKKRWKSVNEFIAQEIRNTPAHIKLQQLQTLFNPAKLFSRATSKEINEVRTRWNRLKEKVHG
jgi:hypothetical protein